MSPSERMRMHLATVGIVLDEPKAIAKVPLPKISPEPDRDAIRSILLAASAPAQDLEWLVASCPSLDDARRYRVPPTYAWCVDCGDAMPCLPDGSCAICKGSA